MSTRKLALGFITSWSLLIGFFVVFTMIDRMARVPVLSDEELKSFFLLEKEFKRLSNYEIQTFDAVNVSEETMKAAIDNREKHLLVLKLLHDRISKMKKPM